LRISAGERENLLGASRSSKVRLSGLADAAENLRFRRTTLQNEIRRLNLIRKTSRWPIEQAVVPA
jgi:hypothetical protein